MVRISLLRITHFCCYAIVFATILLFAVFLVEYGQEMRFCSGALIVTGMTSPRCSELKNWPIYILVVFVLATILLLLTFELSKGSRKPKQKTMREYMSTT